MGASQGFIFQLSSERYESDDDMVSSPNSLSKIGRFKNIYIYIWIFFSRLKSNGTVPARE